LARRSNKKRTSSPPAESATAAAMSSDVKFVTPTEFVELPTRGMFYADDHPLHNVKEVEIKYMTAKEEDILSSSTLLKKGIMLDRFIESILIDKSINAKSLFSGDRNAIMMSARVTGYGPEYDAKVTCPSCSVSSVYTFDLSDYGISYADDLEHLGLVLTDEGTYSFEAEKSKAQIEIRLLDGEDERYLSKVAESKRKNNLMETPLTDLLKMVIASVNGDDSRTTIENYVNSMPAFDSRHLRKIYAQINPNIDLTKDFDCSACGKTTQLEVPLSADFFWPK
jgi:hypothetical protein